MHRRTALSLIAALPFAPRANAAITTAEADWKKIPSTANALLAADVRALYGSAIGKSLGWAKRFSESHHAGLSSLPPTVENVLIAAQFDFQTLQPAWQMGLVKSDWLITLGDIAKSEGSSIGTVADRAAVLSPRNAYFTTSGDKQIAVYAPADRQAFARWLRTVGNGGYAGPSKYLRNAVAEADGLANLVIAADLSDTVDFETAKVYMGALPAVKKYNIIPAVVARLFSSILGFTLQVKADDNLNANLQINFASKIGEVGPRLSEVVDNLLADAGAIIDEIKDWSETLTDNTLSLRGKLTPAGLNHLLMLFELPGSRQVDENLPNAGSGEKVSPTETLKYFKSITNLLAELRNVRFKDNYEKYAMWFDTYAKKVDQMPTRGVDPELAQFGYTLAQKLRATAGSLRGVPLKADQIGAGAYTYIYGSTGGGRWWNRSPGYATINTNVPEMQAKVAKVVQEDASARNELWQKTDDEMAKLKRDLEKKYGLVFQ